MAIITGTSANNTLTGTSGSDLITGKAGNDVITGGGGNDIIDGGAGNDTITAGSGNDIIEGGAGNDTINAGGGTNLVDGGAGDDTITTGSGDDLIDGGAGNDVINAGGGTNLVDGGAGNDTITTGDGIDLIDGGAGNDVINAGGGANIVSGGAGNDTITTGSGLDIIDAGAGNDIIDSGGGCDLVLAGAGDDIVNYARAAGSDGYALFIGEAGRDTLRITVSTAEYNGNATLRAEIAAYQAFLASQNAQRQSFTFTFGDGEARLTVAEFERLELVFTGSSNTAPVANADAGSAGENETRSFDVLANDTDADAGDTRTLVSLGSVTVTSVNGTINGINAASAFAIVGNQISFAAGTLFDALAVGQTATATISYTMRDAAGATSTATLTLTIAGANDAPIVTGAVVSAIGEEDTVPATIALLDNASDVDSGDDLDVSGVSYEVTGGAWANPVSYSVDAGTGTLSIDPAQFDGLGEGDTIELTFSYAVIDGNGGSTPGTAVVTITGAGDAPVITAGDDTGHVTEDGDVTASGDLGVTDADFGDAAAWTVGSATHGTASVDPVTGEWTYELDNDSATIQGLGEGDVITDSFTVTVTDGDLLTDTRVVNITITGTGDAPVITAGNDTGDVTEDGDITASGDLGATDVDFSDSAAWTVGSATYGTATVDPLTGEWTYELDNDSAAVQDLDEGATLTDSFTATVTDGDLLVDTRVVTITIHGTPDNQPTAFGDTVFTNAASGTTLTLDNGWLVRNDTDPNDDPLNVDSASDGTNVDQVTAGATSTDIRVNINAGGSGDFSYTATDGALSSAPATVAVTRGLADNTITGGAGNDILIDGRSDQTLTTLDGGLGSDVIAGGATANAIVADQEDVLIDGGGGTDTLTVATAFDDSTDEQIVNVEQVTLASGAMLNLAQQTEGFTVTGAAGGETITTGSGNDTIRGGAGADNMDGGAGADTFVFNSVTGTSTESADVAVAGNGNDRGQDTITGFDMSADVIRVVATGVARFEHGNQTAVGTGGGGGSVGSDGTANSFATLTGLVSINADLNFNGPADIVINFAVPIGTFNQTAFEGRLQYKLTGDGNINVLIGGSLGDVLNGGGGADTLWGGGGNDILIGGAGEDNIRGDAGADQFRFQTVAGTVDRVHDYELHVDFIGLSGGAAFTTVASAAGTVLNAADFVVRSSVAAMTDADDNRVVLITATGITTGQFALLDSGQDALNTYIIAFNDDINRAEIWFDTNWNNTGSRILVGIIENIDSISALTQITYTDIVIYSGSVDPILLDLDDNGFTFANLTDSRSFDINGDGVADDVAWNTSGDGMLAMDLNGNGVIDDGSELFTPSFGGGAFETGGAALASLDGNGDGVIDSLDAAFGDLLIWRDADADGVTDAGELASLAAWGIASVVATASPGDGLIDGQEVLGTGGFTRADGSGGTYVEIGLEVTLGLNPDQFF